MSLVVFDDSDKERMRKVAEKYSTKPKEETDEKENVEDIAEISKDAKGGSELVYNRIKERIDPELWNHFQIILSRVRTLEDKPKILWFQDTAYDPEVQFLKDDKEKAKFIRFIFPSDWSLEKYNMILGIPYEGSVVLKNAIVPIPDHEKPKKEDGKTRLIYFSTPHRGLDVLAGALGILNKKRDDFEVDIYSSLKLYGWEERDKDFEKLYDTLREMPNVNYHGSVSNDEIREVLQKTHVLAYPNTYQETGCCTAIEAMSAGCVVVCPNWGVLPETCSNFAWMYGMVQDKQEHARKHAYVLNEALDSYWKEEIQMGLTFQTRYFNTFYDVDVVSKQWEMMLMALRERYPTDK